MELAANEVAQPAIERSEAVQTAEADQRLQAIALHGLNYLKMERVEAAIFRVGELHDSGEALKAQRAENRLYRTEFPDTPVPHPEAQRLRKLFAVIPKKIVKVFF